MQDIRKMERILLVDDDAMDVRLITRSFAKTAPDIEIKSHIGSAGAAERMQAGDVDLVLLDINMPGLNGFEVLNQVRKASGGTYPAVIMLTTSTNSADVKRAYSEGANAYLVKPGSGEEMRGLVRVVRDFWAGMAVAAPA
ncbi:MAG: response regulator [Pseudomonadota bacterium]